MTGRERKRLLVGYLIMVLLVVITLYCLFAASRLHGPLDVSLLRSPEIRVALLMMGGLSLVGLLKPLRLVAGDLRPVPPLPSEGTARA